MDPLELKIGRIRARMTQYDVAQKVGIQQSRVSEMERGHLAIDEAVVRAVEEALAALEQRV